MPVLHIWNIINCVFSINMYEDISSSELVVQTFINGIQYMKSRLTIKSWLKFLNIRNFYPELRHKIAAESRKNELEHHIFKIFPAEAPRKSRCGCALDARQAFGLYCTFWNCRTNFHQWHSVYEKLTPQNPDTKFLNIRNFYPELRHKTAAETHKNAFYSATFSKIFWRRPPESPVADAFKTHDRPSACYTLRNFRANFNQIINCPPPKSSFRKWIHFHPLILIPGSAQGCSMCITFQATNPFWKLASFKIFILIIV